MSSFGVLPAWQSDTNRGHKKTSLRVSWEVLVNLIGNTKRGERMVRSLCNVPSDVKFTRFPTTTALQRCANELLVRGWKGMSALLRGLTLPISSRTMSVPHWFSPADNIVILPHSPARGNRADGFFGACWCMYLRRVVSRQMSDLFGKDSVPAVKHENKPVESDCRVKSRELGVKSCAAIQLFTLNSSLPQRCHSLINRGAAEYRSSWATASVLIFARASGVGAESPAFTYFSLISAAWAIPGARSKRGASERSWKPPFASRSRVMKYGPPALMRIAETALATAVSPSFASRTVKFCFTTSKRGSKSLFHVPVAAKERSPALIAECAGRFRTPRNRPA